MDDLIDLVLILMLAVCVCGMFASLKDSPEVKVECVASHVQQEVKPHGKTLSI